MTTRSRTTSFILVLVSVTTLALWTIAAKQAFSSCPMTQEHWEACKPPAGWAHCSDLGIILCNTNTQYGIDPQNGNFGCGPSPFQLQCLTGTTYDEAVCYKQYTCHWNATTGKCTNTNFLQDFPQIQNVSASCN